MEIRTHVTFGGSFAEAMLGSIQAPGDELNRGRVYDMNAALEAKYKARSLLAAKPKMEIYPALQDGPKSLPSLRGLRISVGGRECILAGRWGPANRRKRIRPKAQDIADIVESQAVGQLRRAGSPQDSTD